MKIVLPTSAVLNPATPMPMSVENPVLNYELTIFKLRVDTTISRIDALVSGVTPSVTWTLRYATDRTATGTEVITGGTTTTNSTDGHTITTFTNATIPENNWLWLEITAVSGTVTEINLTLHF